MANVGDLAARRRGAGQTKDAARGMTSSVSVHFACCTLLEPGPLPKDERGSCSVHQIRTSPLLDRTVSSWPCMHAATPLMTCPPEVVVVILLKPRAEVTEKALADDFLEGSHMIQACRSTRRASNI